MLPIALRIGTLILIVLREAYWRVSEGQAYLEKPKVRSATKKEYIARFIYQIAWVYLCFQLLGLHIFSFPHSLTSQIIGFMLVFIGTILSVLARSQLGTNWAHAAEYQIKKEQELVTRGVYRYIRHPIYAAVLLSFVGGEMVAESYLFIPVLIFGLLVSYFQGKKEETILIKHFGKRYHEYMTKSKMLIPYLF